MKIDLRNIQSYWLTCPKSESRHDKFKQMLSKLDIPAFMLNGEITTPYTVGVAKNHIDAISRSLGGRPVLVLEDDAVATSYYLPEIDVPDNADALYLGTSIYGRIRKETSQTVIAADTGEYLRIFNMLSLHAVVYLSDSYKYKIIGILESFIKNPVGGCDDPIADAMWQSNIYSVKKPFFFQQDGHSEVATTILINPIL